MHLFSYTFWKSCPKGNFLRNWVSCVAMFPLCCCFVAPDKTAVWGEEDKHPNKVGLWLKVYLVSYMCNVLEGDLRIFPDYPDSSFKDVQTIILLNLVFTIFHNNMKKRKRKYIFPLIYSHWKSRNQRPKDQPKIHRPVPLFKHICLENFNLGIHLREKEVYKKMIGN